MGGRAGVRMEALAGTRVALRAVREMVKYLEKDVEGVDPTARLGLVTVLARPMRAEEPP
jgi:molybdenum cofactor biosynthesis enzyme